MQQKRYGMEQSSPNMLGQRLQWTEDSALIAAEADKADAMIRVFLSSDNNLVTLFQLKLENMAKNKGLTLKKTRTNVQILTLQMSSIALVYIFSVRKSTSENGVALIDITNLNHLNGFVLFFLFSFCAVFLYLGLRKCAMQKHKKNTKRT